MRLRVHVFLYFTFTCVHYVYLYFPPSGRLFAHLCALVDPFITNWCATFGRAFYLPSCACWSVYFELVCSLHAGFHLFICVRAAFAWTFICARELHTHLFCCPWDYVCVRWCICLSIRQNSAIDLYFICRSCQSPWPSRHSFLLGHFCLHFQSFAWPLVFWRLRSFQNVLCFHDLSWATRLLEALFLPEDFMLPWFYLRA
jgi:hypothetical protein